jgi:hypothetical protein
MVDQKQPGLGLGFVVLACETGYEAEDPAGNYPYEAYGYFVPCIPFTGIFLVFHFRHKQQARQCALACSFSMFPDTIFSS